MKKSGLANSPLFIQPSGTVTIHPSSSAIVKSPTKKKSPPPANTGDTMIPGNRDTATPRHHDTMIPGNHDTVTPCHRDTINQVRQAIGEFGKEAATHRFTVQEKQAIAELVYKHKQRGIKTSENEIVRIALNYLIADHKAGGSKSILAEVLKQAKQK